MNTSLQSGDYQTSFNKFVFDRIPEKSICLDVGCWTGNLGKSLKSEKGCVVDGVDYREDVLNKSKEVGYRNTYQINLNAEEVNFDVITEKYDVIIFADVLEHLINPSKILSSFKNCLSQDGRVVVSLPNVAFGLNRLNLLLGRWAYREFGTLDKTHLKFYTLKTGRFLVETSGFKNVIVSPYNNYSFLSKMPLLLKIWPQFFAYQFLVIGEI